MEIARTEPRLVPTHKVGVKDVGSEYKMNGDMIKKMRYFKCKTYRIVLCKSQQTPNTELPLK